MLLVGKSITRSWNSSIVESDYLGLVFAASGVRGGGLREYAVSEVPAYYSLPSGPVLGLGTPSKFWRV